MPTTAPDITTKAVSGKGTVFSIQTSSSPLTGTVTTNGTAVTWVSGATFVTGSSWDGQQITINGVVYTISSVTDNHDLILTTSAGVQSSAVAFSIPSLAYTQVAELKTLNFSGSKNDSEDVTNFDSNGRAKEYIVTLLDSGEISIAGNYIAGDTGQAAFRAAFSSGAVLSFKMVLPLQAGQTSVGETWVFNGFVEELDNDVQYDKALTFSSKVKITGLVNVTPGS